MTTTTKLILQMRFAERQRIILMTLGLLYLACTGCDKKIVDLPKIPVLRAIVFSSTSVRLIWTDLWTDEEGYKIERKTGSDGSFEQVASTDQDSCGYLDTSLTDGLQYVYRIRAIKRNWHSEYSNEAQVTTDHNPPSGLSATAMSSTEIALNWSDNSSNETSFKIERIKGSEGVFALIDSVQADSTNYLDRDLTEATDYHYRVCAHSDAAGFSNYTDIVFATTWHGIPGRPINVSATALDSARIHLEWDDNSISEYGFLIEQSTGGPGSYTQIDEVEPNLEEYIDSELDEAIIYYYRIRSHNESGPSEYSEAVFDTTWYGLPGVPQSLSSSTISNARIGLSWSYDADDEIGFCIDRKIDGDTVYARIDTVQKNTLTYEDSGLSECKQYTYWIIAYNRSGESAASSADSSTTYPDAPTDLTATAIDSASISLEWSDLSSGGEQGFRIERRTNSTGAFEQIHELLYSQKAQVDTMLAEGTIYEYRVLTFNIAGSSEFSNIASDTTWYGIPDAPSGVTAISVTEDSIKISWIHQGTDISGYKISRKPEGSLTFTQIGTASANETEYIDKGLLEATEYFYQIVAWNRSGTSAPSDEVSAITKLRAPDFFEVWAVSSSQIDLEWPDNSAKNIGYYIERKDADNGEYAVIDSAGPIENFYSDYTVTPTSTYYYRVRAYDARVYSDYTFELRVGAPGELLWSYDTGSWIDSSPAVADDGTIYIGSTDDYLYAFNSDGSVKWNFLTDVNVRTSPAIGTDGTIYFGSGNGFYYALNPNGSLKWSKDLYYDIGNSSPAIGFDGTTYFGVSNGYLYGFNTNGVPIVSYNTGAGIESSPAIGADGTVYVGSSNRIFYALNPNGTYKWSYQTGSAIYSSPAIGTDGTIYIGSHDSNLYAFTPGGDLLWTFQGAGRLESSPVIGVDGTIYIGSLDAHKLYAVTPAGDLAWEYLTHGQVECTPAIGADGVIYFGCGGDRIYAVNPDGSLKWEWDTGYSIYNSSPAITPDGIMYIASGYTVLAIQTNSGGLAPSAWPMFHRDLKHTGRRP